MTDMQFKGEYSWLSNFYYLEKPLTYDGMSFPTVEHFYVAMKSTNQEDRLAVSNHPLRGLKALGRKLELRDDWEEVKVNVMRFAIGHKFSHQNPNLRQKLIDTNDMKIEESNWWNDKFWGVCLKTGKGENWLGKIIMEVRAEVNNEC